jgi:predicted nuclease with TOPRIM domain
MEYQIWQTLVNELEREFRKRDDDNAALVARVERLQAALETLRDLLTEIQKEVTKLQALKLYVSYDV